MTTKVRDALLWAILSALLSQVGEDYLLTRAVRQGVDKVETDLRHIEIELTPRAASK